MKRMKQLFLMLLSIGILFTLRVCTVTRFQSKSELPVVSQKKIAEQKVTDDRMHRTDDRTEARHAAMKHAIDMIQSQSTDTLQVSSKTTFLKTADGLPEPGQRSESTTQELFESGQGKEKDGIKEGMGVRIVQISVQGPSVEDTEVVILPDSLIEASSFTKGFHLSGNKDKKPCCLTVKTRDKKGIEIIQFLPWNQNDPNAFQLHSPMHGYASVAVYESQKLIGQFYIIDFTNEETIPLDLDLCRYNQIARL
jgi:hypothetical protein